jgi:proline iminopeptidase
MLRVRRTIVESRFEEQNMKISPVVLAVLIALILGCGGAESPPLESGPDALALENGSFMVEVDGQTIHYEVHGSGPMVMVLTNSWGLSLEGLHGLFGALEERLTMVYFDPRGMGGSSAVVEDSDMSLAAVREDFHALRRHLGFDTVNVLGWSNGATNLILLTAEQPETIDSAVFVHGVASYGPEDFLAFAQKYPGLTQQYVAFQQEMADESLTDEDRTARMLEMWLVDYFPAIAADAESAAPSIQAAFSDAEFSWAHGQYATKESPAFDFREQLASITARSLVVAGAHDSLPQDKVREISDGIADANFVVFDASGHFAPLEEPDRFARVVFEFFGVD